MKRTLPTPSISHWQIAADGIWEDAKELSVNATPDETQKILLWIDSVGEDIAIEAFFGNKLSDNFGFFGARLSSLSKQEQKSFVQKLVGDVTDSDHFETVSDKFEQILTSFIHKESQKKIFDRPPDFLELGAEGFWKSYGSYVVWQRGESSPKSIDDIQQNAPQLLRPFERAIMIEHAYKNPVPMWLAIPVSRKTNNGFIFDEEKYLSITKAVIFSRRLPLA